MDFDPRDIDSRDDERYGLDRERASRDDSDLMTIATGTTGGNPTAAIAMTMPASSGAVQATSLAVQGQTSTGTILVTTHGRRNATATGASASSIRDDVFTRNVHLPRGFERGIVHYRDREYTLRRSESRTLGTVGAFRVGLQS